MVDKFGRSDRRQVKTTQRGAVLLLAMIFLLLLAIISGTVIQTSILEFQMAGNDQFREEAFQKAQAVASSLAEDPNNFPVSGGVGYRVCQTGYDDSDDAAEDKCNLKNITLKTSVAAVPAGVSLTYDVRREGPLFLENLPFRQSQDDVSSSKAFDAAIFEVNVNVDGSAARLGNAGISQGVARLVTSSTQ